MNSEEFMKSPLAGALSAYGWAVSAKDVIIERESQSDTVFYETVDVNISYQDDFARGDSGVNLSFRMDDLDISDIEEIESDFEKITDAFDVSEESSIIEKELIVAEATDRGSPEVSLNRLIPFGTDFFSSASIKADQGFIGCQNISDISAFVERARDSVESLRDSVLVPYKQNSLDKDWSIDIIGYIDNGRQTYGLQKIDSIDGTDYARVCRVEDGRRMPTEHYPIREDDEGNRVIDFYGNGKVPESEIKYIDKTDVRDIPVVRDTQRWSETEDAYMQSVGFPGNKAVERYNIAHEADMQCKRAIKAAVDENFDGVHLNPDGIKSVIETYGPERTEFVLASMAQAIPEDGRIIPDNREWAKSVIGDDEFNDDRQPELDSFRTDIHPAVLDGVIRQARNEIDSIDSANLSEPAGRMEDSAKTEKTVEERLQEALDKINHGGNNGDNDGGPDGHEAPVRVKENVREKPVTAKPKSKGFER